MMDKLAVSIPEVPPVPSGLEWEADTLVVQSQDDANSASTLLASIRAEIKNREALFAPALSAANASLKTLRSLRDSAVAPLKEMDAKVSIAIRTWSAMETKRRQKEADEALARMAEDRLRLDKQRRAAEAELLEKKSAALTEGDLFEVARLAALQDQISPFQDPLPALPPVAAPVKLEGMSTAKTWHYKVDDLRALALAVAEGLVSEDFIVPSAKLLNDAARRTKGPSNIPGVIFYCEEQLRVKGGAAE